jgi:uncharacterized protein (PEP-CTERM system associated)
MHKPHSVASILLVVSTGVCAQDSVSNEPVARMFSITPRISVTETLTDNVRLASTAPQSEWVTRFSPGIRVVSNAGRLQGYFDYSLDQLVYAQTTSANTQQNSLNTAATLEAVDNWAYIDFSGSISQQAISAFGAQSNDNVAINPNRTEVSSYRFSPYVRGRIGSLADYEVRYSRADTRSDSMASDVSSVDSMARISGASAFRNLGWSADVSQQKVDYSAGRATESERLNLILTYALSPQLRVSATGGREANNFTTLDKESYSNSGFGVNWSPSPLTRVQASRTQRSFGDTHNVSLEHRTAKTAWRFTDAKDVSVTPNQTGLASRGAVFDILFDQFATIEPNPTARAQLVNAYLQANGINPNAVVISSYLTSAVALQRRQDVSLALIGVRDTVTFIASRSQNNRLDLVSVGADDLSTSSVLMQHGFSINYAHRLTPDYSLGVLLSQQKISGELSQQDVTLRSLNFSISGRLGKKSTGLLSVVRVVSGGSVASYAENAVTVNLIVQF